MTETAIKLKPEEQTELGLLENVGSLGDSGKARTKVLKGGVQGKSEGQVITCLER